MKQRGITSWLRYSGASVALTLNPWHWYWGIRFWRENDVWDGPQERTWRMSCLMLTVRVWIDDGSW